MPIIKILFVSWLIITCSYAQNSKKIDSLINIINETDVDTTKAINYLWIAEFSMYNDPKLTIEVINKAEKLYEKTNYTKQMGKVYGQKANYYYRQGKIDSSRHYLSKSVVFFLKQQDTLRAANIRHNIGILDHYQGKTDSALEIMETNIQVFKNLNDSLRLGNTYHMIGSIFESKGYYTIALENMLKALKIHRAVKDDFRIAEDLSQIGSNYQALEEHQKAIETFTESYSIFNKEENTQKIAFVQNAIGFSNLALNKYDAAEKNFNLALETSIDQGYKANIARAYVNLGNLEYSKHKYTKSLDFLTKGYTLWESISSPNSEADALFFMGRAALADKKYQKSIQFLNKSIQLGDSINDPRILSKAYLHKSIALENLNYYKESLENFKKTKVFSDTLFTLENRKATKELQIIYETEKKEQQIVLQKNEINLLEQKVKINNLQRILLVVGLVVLLLIFSLSFYAFRQKIKHNRLEKEKVANELAFKKRELTTHALHLAKKNEVLEEVKQKAKNLKISENNSNDYHQLIQTINFDLQDDNNWEKFSRYFEQVHTNFNSNVKNKYPNVTPNELRLLALLKMNLSSKEIANILNISPEGIKKARYRLRKKLNITTEESLQDLAIRL
ncbi:tetratricopeptide repeat protein [Aquimarina pacifica]|uniref:tetratricopeptide repeat protein n=1 Tax=Aquimarina pacifica TaxID=1296415 RepID=UPI00046ECD15|nr:tetratricopeptide repeat protein [Aquimarina pacifica]